MSAFNKEMLDAWCRYRMGRVATQSQSDAFTAGYRDGLAKGIDAAAKVVAPEHEPPCESVYCTSCRYSKRFVAAIERLKEE